MNFKLIFLTFFGCFTAINFAQAQTNSSANNGLTRVELVKTPKPAAPAPAAAPAPVAPTTTAAPTAEAPKEPTVIRKAVNVQTGEVLYREVITVKELEAREARAKNTDQKDVRKK